MRAKNPDHAKPYYREIDPVALDAMLSHACILYAAMASAESGGETALASNVAANVVVAPILGVAAYQQSRGDYAEAERRVRKLGECGLPSRHLEPFGLTNLDSSDECRSSRRHDERWADNEPIEIGA